MAAQKLTNFYFFKCTLIWQYIIQSKKMISNKVKGELSATRAILQKKIKWTFQPTQYIGTQVKVGEI